MENRVSKAMPVRGESDPGDDAMPHKRNTDSAEPIEERSRIFDTAKRSQSIPMQIPPTIEVALKSETSIVPIVLERLTVAVE